MVYLRVRFFGVRAKFRYFSNISLSTFLSLFICVFALPTRKWSSEEARLGRSKLSQSWAWGYRFYYGVGYVGVVGF